MAQQPGMTPQPAPPPTSFDWGSFLNSPALSGMSDADMNARANAEADAQIQAQANPIILAQQAAARRALGGEQATIGFTNTGIGQLGQIAPGLAQAYGGAQSTMQGIGGQLSPEASPFAQFAAQQIGGENAAGQGWANMLGQIQGNQGQADLANLIAQSESQQGDYEQQLINLAGQRPELKQQIIDQLHQRELDKLQVRLSVAQTAQQAQQADRQYGLDTRRLDQDIKDSDRTYGLNKAQFGESKREFGITQAESKRQFNVGHQFDVKKFEEDVRQFGLNYALSQQQYALQKQQFGEGVREFNANLGEQKAEFGVTSGQNQQQIDQNFKIALGNLRVSQGNLDLTRTEQDWKKVTDTWAHSIDLRNIKVQERAQDIVEKQFGLSKDQFDWSKSQDVIANTLAAADSAMKAAGLAASNVLEATAAVAKAASEGKTIDRQQSLTAGHLVASDGSDILDSKNNVIPVDPRNYGGGGSTGDKPVNPKKLLASAVGDARTLYGSPVDYSGANSIDTKVNGRIGTYQIKGKYQAAENAKGVYSLPIFDFTSGKVTGYIRTTNDPKKAKHDNDGDYGNAIQTLILKNPGLTPSQARRALKLAGWLPPAKTQ